MTEKFVGWWKRCSQSERERLLRSVSPGQKRKILQRVRFVVCEGDDDWLHWWVRTFLGVHIPKEKVCVDHDAPFTAFAAAFFGRAETIVVHGSRLFGGKTFLSCVLGLTRAILLRAEIYILGGSEDQSKTMQRYMKNDDPKVRGMFWEWKRAPKHLLRSATATEISLTNGASMTALAASQKRTRGKHGTDLFVDEADELDVDVFKSALGQTYEGTRGITPLNWITSTWQHPEGTMTEIFDMAEEMGWEVYEWCYRETHVDAGGHITQEEVERKRRNMPTLDWLTEVELNRPSTGDIVFSPEIIEVLFDPSLGKFEDILGHEYTLIPPHDDDPFYHGADWAKDPDLTIIPTFKENYYGPDQLAAYSMHSREPYPVMMGHFDSRVRRYGGPACFDGTGMGGDIIEDNLSIDALAFDFARRKELHEMYSGLINDVENGGYVLPEIPRLKRKIELLTRGQVYESTRTSKKNHTPDEFAAWALARKAKMEHSFELLLGRAY